MSAVGASEPAYFTPRQVAAMLQVNERTVLRWADRDSTMPSLRLGKIVRFERAALLRWLARRQPARSRTAAETAAPSPQARVSA